MKAVARSLAVLFNLYIFKVQGSDAAGNRFQLLVREVFND
jgi:hypothetical protein